MKTTEPHSAALTSFVVGSRYLPVYVGLAILLVIVASIWGPPAALSGVAARAIAPYGAVLGILAALGQMLVLMTVVYSTLSVLGDHEPGSGHDGRAGPIERSYSGSPSSPRSPPSSDSPTASSNRPAETNALIVTLAVGLVVVGVVNRYEGVRCRARCRPGCPIGRRPASSVSAPSSGSVLGSPSSAFGFTGWSQIPGRGGQPGGRPRRGSSCEPNQILVYVVAANFSRHRRGGAGGGTVPPVSARRILLARSAAVGEFGGAATGGLASPTSTFAAAIFLTGSQPDAANDGAAHALQFVVFGLVIIGYRWFRAVPDHSGAWSRCSANGNPKPWVTDHEHVHGGSMRREACISESCRSSTQSRRSEMASAIDQGEVEHQKEQDHRHRADAHMVAAACRGPVATTSRPPPRTALRHGNDREHRATIGVRGERRCRPSIDREVLGPRAVG